MNAPLTELDLTRIDPTLGRTPDPASPAAEALLARVLATPRTPEDLTRGTTTATVRRSARLRRRWVLVGAAAAVTAAGLVASQVVSDAGTPQAFASWTSDPTPLTAEQAATAEADCLALMTDEGRTPRGERVAGLADTRGGYLAALAATDQGVATCLSALPGRRDPVLGAGTGLGAWVPADAVAAPAPDGTTVVFGGGMTTAQGSYTQAFGRAGADVTGVVLTDADGRRVQATLGGGWFTAWWPAEATDSLTVRTTLADGRTTERVVHRGEH
ncbi:hypothetical protein [Quadrisphaera setariae]|uniref:Uncharacterized protein n=1 Tax=Quadrisphaera setariae TaxID=2593304 RepID=A0A5C8ZF90_9ACTN|nr:hypothetical protein [Quadrisphaera setariae]TXR56154.1 hypothetical protein FMM08_12060 [Quadrisphaera setariae]